MAGAEEAAEVFKSRDLHRLVEAMRECYERNGRAAGSVVIADPTDEERRGFASIKAAPVIEKRIRFDLPWMGRWLRGRGFECDLGEMLAAYYGHPMKSEPALRAAERGARAERKDAWQAALERIARRSEVRGRLWLEANLEALLKRYGRHPESEIEARLAAVDLASRVLSILPLSQPESLAVIANRFGSNPHALDPREEAGELLVSALAAEHGERLTPPLSRQDRPSATQRQALLDMENVLLDLTSARILVFNLAGAVRLDGSADPVGAIGPGEEQQISLRRLLSWQRALPSSDDVYLLENPTAYGLLLPDLEDTFREGKALPTLVCTNGQFGRAEWRLLELFLEGAPSCRFHYAGDFDPTGLRIAAGLRARYPEQFRAWHLDAISYRVAVRASREDATDDGVRSLESMAQHFPDLVVAMVEHRRWAYQEETVDLLKNDLLGARTTGVGSPAGRMGQRGPSESYTMGNASLMEFQ